MLGAGHEGQPSGPDQHLPRARPRRWCCTARFGGEPVGLVAAPLWNFWRRWHRTAAPRLRAAAWGVRRLLALGGPGLSCARRPCGCAAAELLAALGPRRGAARARGGVGVRRVRVCACAGTRWPGVLCRRSRLDACRPGKDGVAGRRGQGATARSNAVDGRRRAAKLAARRRAVKCQGFSERRHAVGVVSHKTTVHDAASEDRAHDLRIMRPTRCQLRCCRLACPRSHGPL